MTSRRINILVGEFHPSLMPNFKKSKGNNLDILFSCFPRPCESQFSKGFDN